MIFGCDDESQVLEGLLVQDFIEKYNELRKNRKIHNISKELINKAYTPDKINEYYNKAGKLLHYYQRISWIKRLSQPYERKQIA
jgi:hypothetical protein